MVAIFDPSALLDCAGWSLYLIVGAIFAVTRGHWVEYSRQWQLKNELKESTGKPPVPQRKADDHG